MFPFEVFFKVISITKQENVLSALNIKENDILKAISTFNSRF